MQPNRILPHFTALLLLLLSVSCGYYNPNLLPAEQQGPPITLHVPLWTGPSNEIRLTADIHNALQNWLIQAKRITLVADAGSADYVLSGKILSVHSPGRSYDNRDHAQALKVILSVEYALTDTRSGKVIWQTRNQSMEKTYTVGVGTAQTEANRRNALEVITNELAETIYIRMHRAIARHKKESGGSP